jgi:peptide deformylase
MAVREICKYPDPVLTEKAAKVEVIDDGLRKLVQDMAETMYEAHGVGLAAPQVGVSKRVIVVDVSHVEEGEGRLLVLINPELAGAEGSEFSEEGCLSLPGFKAEVRRSVKVTVRGRDIKGRDVAVEAEGLMARALQHEIDHLEGTLILDRAGFLSREFYKKRLKTGLVKAG